MLFEIVLFKFVLFKIVLFENVLFKFVLFEIVLFENVLFKFVLFENVLFTELEFVLFAALITLFICKFSLELFAEDLSSLPPNCDRSTEFAILTVFVFALPGPLSILSQLPENVGVIETLVGFGVMPEPGVVGVGRSVRGE